MIRLLELIISDEARRGNGTEENPHRAIYQVWTKDGQLLAELDYQDPHRAEWQGLLGAVPTTWTYTQ